MNGLPTIKKTIELEKEAHGLFYSYTGTLVIMYYHSGEEYERCVLDEWMYVILDPENINEVLWDAMPTDPQRAFFAKDVENIEV